MKKRNWDILVIVLLGVLLVILNETNNIPALFKFPFVTIYGAYVIGRLVGGSRAA